MPSKKPINIIVACSENRVIASQGAIPWRIKEDFQYLMDTVAGGVVIEGRNTYEDMGKAYPKSKTIVVTRSAQSYPDAYTTPSIAEAVELAHTLEDATPIWIGGGQRIYEAGLALADRLYLTLVHTVVEGDTFFPEWRSEFTEAGSKRESSNGKYNYPFLVLERPGA